MTATILLADHEPAMRSLIEAALAAEGYRVLAAKNGFEALQVFDQREADIDMVITDMRMPYLGGSELIAALQARRRLLKCLGICGHTVEPDFDCPILTKPFSRTDLLRTVEQLLGG